MRPLDSAARLPVCLVARRAADRRSTLFSTREYVTCSQTYRITYSKMQCVTRSRRFGRGQVIVARRASQSFSALYLTSSVPIYVSTALSCLPREGVQITTLKALVLVSLFFVVTEALKRGKRKTTNKSTSGRFQTCRNGLLHQPLACQPLVCVDLSSNPAISF